MHRTHLLVFEQSAIVYADALAFKIPVFESPDASSGTLPLEWRSITYRQFWIDIESCARKWSRILHSEGISRRSVVGVWLLGNLYNDIVLVYAILRAGYIPQLISFNVTSRNPVCDLLERTAAKALICSPSLLPSPNDPDFSPFPFPVFVPIDWKGPGDEDEQLPDLHREHSPDEVVMIHHTSGSTSGRPKLVPVTRRWLEGCVQKAHEYQRLDRKKHLVTVLIGSICHAGAQLMMLNCALGGYCIVQPTRFAFSSEELMDMIERCGLNFLQIFASYLANHLQNSRKDVRLLAMLKRLELIECGGVPLPLDDTHWAMRNRMNLRTVFASTEGGMLLHSTLGHTSNASLYRPFKGSNYAFVPLNKASLNHEETTSKLLELVILSSSPDFPDVSLSGKDGHFHTGDIFEEVEPGLYRSLGRDDDFIKLFTSSLCNTREIEDNVRATCSDLIERCVVVGSLRPSVALVVEIKQPGMGTEELRREILRRISPFHANLMHHERIRDHRKIIVVPAGSLPRTATKGNVRRQAAEQLLKEQLDSVYTVA